MAQYLPIFAHAGAGRRLRRAQPRGVPAARPPQPDRRPRRRPTSAASSPTSEPPERFPVRFYLVAMIFIVFDIEIIFFFPWADRLPRARAVRPRSRSLIFAVAVFESFVYLISNGALDWGPVKRLRRVDVVDARPHHDHDHPPGRPRRPRAVAERRPSREAA